MPVTHRNMDILVIPFPALIIKSLSWKNIGIPKSEGGGANAWDLVSKLGSSSHKSTPLYQNITKVSIYPVMPDELHDFFVLFNPLLYGQWTSLFCIWGSETILEHYLGTFQSVSLNIPKIQDCMQKLRCLTPETKKYCNFKIC